MLKIQLKGRDSEAVWVVEKNYGIGRDAANHLVLDDDSISPVHARLITKDNKLYLKDNNSQTGSFVNERRVTQKQVTPGDLIRLGAVEIAVLDPREPASQDALGDGDMPGKWTLVSDSSWLSGQEFNLTAAATTIGRGSNCDITIPGTHLSRQHAEISIKGTRLHVRDLASANGTYLNDTRISEAFARPGDRLRLDVYSFRIIGPEVDDKKTRVRPRPGSRRKSAGDTPAAEPKLEPKLEPKQWKMRSTSPGNRVEPPQPSKLRLLPWISGGLFVILITLLIYLLAMV